MKTLYSEIEINATSQQVWACLTDFERLPAWNPFMQRASGSLQVGKQIEVYLAPPAGSAMTIKPTVLKVKPNNELRWLGHLLVKGLFDGEHYFKIEQLADNRVKFKQGEEFHGLLVAPIIALIGKNTLAGFEAMNAALKTEAEHEGFCYEQDY